MESEDDPEQIDPGNPVDEQIRESSASRRFRRRFVTTRWDQIDSARKAETEEGLKSLNELLKTYLPALKTFLSQQYELKDDEAKELLQSFVLRNVLQNSLLDKAHPTRGKFRSLLLSALTNFVIDEFRWKNAKMRIPSELLVSWENLSEDMKNRSMPAAYETAFEYTFTLGVLKEGFQRLRRYLENKGKFTSWEVFDVRLVQPFLDDTKEAESLKRIAERLQLNSTDKVSNLLMSAKRTFVAILKDVVEEYASDTVEADEERVFLQSLIGM